MPATSLGPTPMISETRALMARIRPSSTRLIRAGKGLRLNSCENGSSDSPVESGSAFWPSGGLFIRNLIEDSVRLPSSPEDVTRRTSPVRNTGEISPIQQVCQILLRRFAHFLHPF